MICGVMTRSFLVLAAGFSLHAAFAGTPPQIERDQPAEHSNAKFAERSGAAKQGADRSPRRTRAGALPTNEWRSPETPHGDHVW